MPLSLEIAKSLLERRDQAFIDRDVDGYIELWSEHARIEGPDHVIVGRDDLRRSLEQAWRIWQPLHMSATSVAVDGWMLHHEFVSVWERRGQTTRRLITGVGVAEIDKQGRFLWLREYFDPAGSERESVIERPEIAALVPDDGFDTGA